MNKLTTTLLCVVATTTSLCAKERVLYNFEDMTVGTELAMRDFGGASTTASKAVVANDPSGRDNKVLHVKNASLNTLVELLLPSGITPEVMTTGHTALVFDLYRPATETDHYRQFICRLGDDNVYYKDNDWKFQGGVETWTSRAYTMNAVNSSTDKLYLGYNSDNMEYYIDNIRLFSTDGDYDVNTPSETLRYYADKLGLNIGVAVPVWSYNVDNDNVAEVNAIRKNFNYVVAENEMKPEYVQPSRGKFEFNNGDRLIKMAERNDIGVRGHTLIWHSQTLKWVSSDGYKNTGNFTRAELLKVMEEHITGCMTHWKGKIKEWDVVNEVLDDNQDIVRTDETAYNLRKSVWFNVIGEDFIDSAFVYAHRADPDALLYINDYGVEFKGGAKTEAYYNLIKRLRKSNIPVQGVGFQTHINSGDNAKKFEDNVKRYDKLNLKCAITEIDIATSDKDNQGYLNQATDYESFLNVAIAQPHIDTFMIWGLTDGKSWRKDGSPLIFTDDLSPKFAFYFLRNALARALGKDIAGLESIDDIAPTQPANDDVMVVELTGRIINPALPRTALHTLTPGIYIIDGKKTAIR